MRCWASLLMFAFAVAAFVHDPARLHLLRQAAYRHLPTSWSGRFAIDVERPESLRGRRADLATAVIDRDLPVTLRLGAAELLLGVADLTGEVGDGPAFERLYATLWEAVTDAPQEPALAAVLVDAARLQRRHAWNGPPGAADDVVARHAARLAREADVDNGYPTLLLVDVALSSARMEEGRDLLVEASRASRVDGYPRRRAAAAAAYLESRGVAGLDAWEFVIGLALGDAGAAPADWLRDLGVTLGDHDAAQADADPDRWIRTYLAIHECAVGLMRSSLTVDAANAVSRADLSYLSRVRGAVPALSGAQGVQLDDVVLEQFASAGYTRGFATLVENRREATGLRVSFERRRRKVEATMHDTTEVELVTAMHSLLVPWSATSLLLAILALCLVAVTSRPKSIPGSLTLAVGAVIAQGLVVVYLGGHELFPLRPPPGEHWIFALERPHWLVYALPLVSLPVMLAPYLVRKELRTKAVLSRVAGGFHLGLSALLLLLFATTAPFVDELRDKRRDALDLHCVEAYLTEEGSRF